MNEMPHILIVGAGAVGGFYGAKLAQGGARVAALCRSDFDVVSERGIEVKSILGDFVFHPDEVVKEISNYSKKPDYILVATKVLPEIDVPGLIRERVSPDTAIILLQNGIGIEESVAKTFSDNEIISGLAFICVTRIARGVIHHQDFGRIVIGRYPRGSSDKVACLATVFKNAGVECDVATEIVTARWKKLIWNAPFNPISVLSGGADTKTIMESPPALELVTKVMEEVRLIACAAGHTIPEEVIEKNLNDTRVMKPYKTSMLLDYESGRPMEVEAILGNAMRIALEHHIPVPHIESLYGLLTLVNNAITLRKN